MILLGDRIRQDSSVGPQYLGQGARRLGELLLHCFWQLSLDAQKVIPIPAGSRSAWLLRMCLCMVLAMSPSQA